MVAFRFRTRKTHAANGMNRQAKNQQTFLIQQFGPNVNLGNIPTGEVLALEALRAGLRFETFYRIAEELERTGQWHPETIEEPDTVQTVSVVSPQNSEKR